MTRFYPIYVRRSDGKLEVNAKAKRKELNQPTGEQLDQRPDKNGVSDFYREVAVDEPKHLDWRRKLGGMLAREMDWKDKNVQPGQETGYMLVSFPENYRLFEHVKKTEKDGKTEVKSKTHAAGGNDRQDAYLYGHPSGRKKRYRSPADFFPHLLWLCTDESGDPDNCGCKVCSPEDLADVMPETKNKVKPEAAGQHTFAMAKHNSGQGVSKVKQEGATPVPRPVPTNLSPPKSQDQHLDRQYNTFMYRPGELVWFQRGQAWGLGAVLRRWRTTADQYHYTVQPLSHPYRHPRSVVKSSHREMRPWLAWSVPLYTNTALNTMPDPPRYETLDWDGLLQRQYGQGDDEVDGSILAAKSIDSSYTLIEPTKTADDRQATETHFEGLFLGAEKLWVGDPVRLLSGSGSDILVVHSIIERVQKPSPTQKHPSSPQRTVYLVGDTYELHQISHSNPSLPNPSSAVNNPHLPPRLTEDLAFRNARAIPTRYTVSFWKLTSAHQRVEINDIKGRWYEASLLMPVLQKKEEWEASCQNGEIREVTLWMNARGDSVNANRAPNLPRLGRENIPRATRAEAFGRALPPGAEIRDGIEPPLLESVDPALDPALGAMASQSSMEIDPRFETAENAHLSDGSDDIRVTRPGEQQMLNAEGHLDEFMDLDGAGDGHPLPGGYY